MPREPYAEQLARTLFVPHFISFVRAGSGFACKRRWLRHRYLLLFKSGTGEIVVDGTSYPIMPGKLFMLRPGMIAEARFESASAPQLYMARFSAQTFGGNGGVGQMLPDDSLAFWPGDVELAISTRPQTEAQLDQLIGLKGERHRLGRWKRTVLFQQLLLTIAEGVIGGREHGQDQRDTIGQVLSYMNEHYMEQLPIRSLARMHGISPTNFAAMFRKRTGVSPVEYLTRLRIEKAKSALFTRERMADVALKVGYRDELYFSRMFKRIVGVAPTLYIKKHSGENVMAIDPILTDYLLALGVEPTAAVCYEGGGHIDGRLPYLAGRLDNTRFVGSCRQPDLKRAVEVSPRLVLGVQQHNGAHAAVMNKIAPTILVSILNDWRALLSEIAGLTEKSEQGRAWLHDFELKASFAKSRLLEAVGRERSVMVLIVTEDGLRVYGGKRQLGELLYRDLGLKAPRGIKLDEHYRAISAEDLLELDPDYIFLTIVNWGSCLERKRQLKESGVWSSLRSVRGNRVFEVDSWMNNHAPLGRSAAIDRVSALLLNAE